MYEWIIPAFLSTNSAVIFLEKSSNAERSVATSVVLLSHKRILNERMMMAPNEIIDSGHYHLPIDIAVTVSHQIK